MAVTDVPTPADLAADDADRAFTAMAGALAAAVENQAVDSAADHLRDYLEREDTDVSRLTRLCQLVATAAIRVAEVYRAWQPEGPWEVEPAHAAGEQPTGPAILAARLLGLVLNAEDDMAAGVVVEALADEQAGRVLAAVMELAATWGLAMRAVTTAE